MRQLFPLIFFLFVQHVLAQDYTFKSYDFNDDVIELSESERQQDELLIFQHRKVELVAEDGSARQFFLLHQQMLVNSDQAIEENNKIYIGFDENSRVVKNKNRVFLPDGRTIELNEKDIHEEVDEESGRKYQYYAVKGLEKGAIIEKLYVIEELPSLKGRSYTFQNDMPVRESTFELIYPDHLVFKTKSYNGLTIAVLNDSLYEDKHVLTIQEKDIQPINAEEKLANIGAHMQRFKFRLFENKLSGVKNFFNYNEFAKNYYTNFSEPLSKKDNGAIESFLKNISRNADERMTILAVESLIKENIVYNDQYSENETLRDVLNSKQANLLYLLKVYRAAFDKFGIESQFIFTADRYIRPFDPDFETTTNIEEVLFYFPKTKQYLDPKNISLRSPLFNYQLGNTHGIAIKEVEFAGTKMATTEPWFIELDDSRITSDTMIIEVDFTKEIDNALVKSRIVFGGYAGANMQPLKDYFSPDEYEKVLTDVSKNYSADVELETNQASNDGIEHLGRNNFELNMTFFSSDLIQKAGDKYLYQLGRLIGRQSEIYQPGERTMPVELQYPHFYDRTIILKLPEGYKISNPEVLNFDFKLEREGETDARFTSTYDNTHGLVTITNKEYYAKVNYSLDEFEAFSSVYNAAADFNKVTIILEKK